MAEGGLRHSGRRGRTSESELCLLHDLQSMLILNSDMYRSAFVLRASELDLDSAQLLGVDR